MECLSKEYHLIEIEFSFSLIIFTFIFQKEMQRRQLKS